MIRNQILNIYQYIKLMEGEVYQGPTERKRETERGVTHQCPNLSYLFQFAINFDPQYNSCPNL